MNKADVYRKAAEIIVRDGKYDGGTLVDADYPNGITEELALMDRSRPVCALGACARAEFELYGTMPHLYYGGDVYDVYGFAVGGEWAYPSSGAPRKIHYINDRDDTTAEDMALLLKQRAEEVESQ